MNEKNHKNKKLFGILSWLIIVLYLLINVGVVINNTPFEVMIAVLPLTNIILIVAWFFVRTFYNKANDAIKHQKYLDSKAPEIPIPTYSPYESQKFIPHVKIDTELFNSIDLGSGNKYTFDITLKNYLKQNNIIIFHDEMNYGLAKTVEVSHVYLQGDVIEASFIKPSSSAS